MCTCLPNSVEIKVDKVKLRYLFNLAPWDAYQSVKFNGGAEPRWGANLREGV